MTFVCPEIQPVLGELLYLALRLCMIVPQCFLCACLMLLLSIFGAFWGSDPISRCRLSMWAMEFAHFLAQAVLDSQSVSLAVGKEQCLCFETQFRWDLTQSSTHQKFLMIHLAQPSGRQWGLLLVTRKRPVETYPPGKLKVSEKWNESSLAPCTQEGAKAASKNW